MADVEVHDEVQIFDPFFCFIACLLRCSINFIILPPTTYRSEFSVTFVVARDQDRMYFIWKKLVQYDNRVLSMLRMILGFGPSYISWFVAIFHPQIRNAGMIVSEVFFNSISPTLPISKIARLDSSLNIICK